MSPRPGPRREGLFGAVLAASAIGAFVAIAGLSARTAPVTPPEHMPIPPDEVDALATDVTCEQTHGEPVARGSSADPQDEPTVAAWPQAADDHCSAPLEATGP